jgi:hypothetical protein
MKLRAIAILPLLLANLAHAAPPERHRVELALSAGTGLRETRGGFDTGRFGGYAVGMPAAGGVEAAFLFAGRHGPIARGTALFDLPIDSVATEHFNLWVVDLGWAYRATLVRRGTASLDLTPSAGLSLAHADAVWSDGLHFILPCLPTLDPSVSDRCQAGRDALRDTDTTFDHDAVGGFVSTTLAFELGQLRFGAAVDERLLSALGDGPSFLHHVTTVRALGGVAFEL